MALIRCSECGKEFSDKAAACPNCGCPTSEMVSTQTRSFDDVFDAVAALKVVNAGSIENARATIDTNENVIYATIINASIAPSHQALSDKFSVKGKVSGVLAITERRVLFINSVLGRGTQKEIAIKDIASIDSKTSLMNCPVRIKGLTEMFIIDCNSPTQKKILEALAAVRK